MTSSKERFAAIDFELATGVRNSVCAVGIVVVENGEIVDEYYSLVRPPKNKYHWGNSRVTKIYAKDTKNAPNFLDIYPEIEKRLKGRKMVAHNEGFDRDVLKTTMQYYGLDYRKLRLPEKWEDTVTIFQEKGAKSAKLNKLAKAYGIKIDHHNALSDARATALLYLRRHEDLIEELEEKNADDTDTRG